jgi:hypothetical protein
VRRLAWTAIGCLVLAVVVSLVAQATEAEPLYLLSGLLLLTALGMGIVALPVWARLGLRLPAMPGLFPPVGPGQEWDPVTGAPVPRTAKPPRAARAPGTARSAKPARTDRALFPPRAPQAPGPDRPAKRSKAAAPPPRKGPIKGRQKP